MTRRQAAAKPPMRGPCSTAETIANLLLIGCCIALVLVAAVGAAVAVWILSQNVTNFNYFATF